MTLFEIIILIVIAIILLAVMPFALTVLHMINLGRGLQRIRNHAYSHIYDSFDAMSAAMTGDKDFRRHRFASFLAVSGVYTICRTEEGELSHHFSVKSVLPLPKLGARSFLFLFGIIAKQAQDAGVMGEEKKEFFRIEQSELGTYHLDFTIDEEGQQKLEEMRKRPG